MHPITPVINVLMKKVKSMEDSFSLTKTSSTQQIIIPQLSWLHASCYTSQLYQGPCPFLNSSSSYQCTQPSIMFPTN